MKKGQNKRSTPPPLPDVAAANGNPVEPPPIVDGAAEEKPVSDQPEAPVDPIAEFLSRAGAVLALERGMNPRSRVKLAAIAEELGLSDDEFDTVMEQLLGGESKAQAQKELSRDELRQLRRQKRQFLDHVGWTLGPRSKVDPERAARAVFDVIWQKVDPGEVAKVINLFPEELRDLWPRRV